MSNFISLLAIVPLAGLAAALPATHHRARQLGATNSIPCAQNATCGPIPGSTPLYNNYTGKSPPFPTSFAQPIAPTVNGPPGTDDLLFQNLLSAEYVIFSFYQQGVDNFTSEDFTSLGLPNNTYERIVEIRDNEAGHLRIFQDSISPTSLKPGPCEYSYPVSNAREFLALQAAIEISSEAFLTGLVLQARLDASRSALVAIGEVEARHNTWSLIEIWGADPFTGPADTVFPYANEILDVTRRFIKSCPEANPQYPSPRQALPYISVGPAAQGGQLAPGAEVKLDISGWFDERNLVAVWFHGVSNVTVAYDPASNTTTIPAEWDGKGIGMVVLADAAGAPTLESVKAGPGLVMFQPSIPGATF